MEGDLYETYKVAFMEEKLQECLEKKKHVIVWDKNEKVATMLGSYFSYKSFNVELHRLSIGLRLQQFTKDHVLEELRKAAVAAMKNGNLLVIDVGNLTPDFINDFTGADSDFNSHLVFDWDAIRDRNNHIKMVREEENMDIFGDKGNFACKPTFNVMILAKFRDESAC